MDCWLFCLLPHDKPTGCDNCRFHRLHVTAYAACKWYAEACFNSIENITKDVVKPGVATLQPLRLYPLNALSITHLVELNLQPQPIALVGEGCIWFYGSRAWGKPIVPRKGPGPVRGSGWICRRSSEGAGLSRTCRAAGHLRLEVAGFFPLHRTAAAGLLAGTAAGRLRTSQQGLLHHDPTMIIH